MLHIGQMPYAVNFHILTGGLWYYTDHKRPNQGAAAYKELVSNDAKELMAFTDFPMPEKNEMVIILNTYLFK